MTDEQSCLGPDIDWSPIPFHCREGLEQHFAQGRPVGDFLAAVLSNDLAGAVTRADISNLYILRDYVHFLHAHAPPASYGSRKAFLEWQGKGGLAGIERTSKSIDRINRERDHGK